MDSNFSHQEKDQQDRKFSNQFSDPQNKASSQYKKKTSISKLLNPDSSSNVKKPSKANLNEAPGRLLRQNSKKSTGVKTPEPKKPQPQRVRSEVKRNKNLKSKKNLIEISPKKRSMKKPKNLAENIIKENSLFKTELSVLNKDRKLKKGKKSHENFRDDEKIRKIDIKHYLADLNKVTREENLKKFKHEKFKPKCAWGLDERRLAIGSCSKNFKEVEIARKKFRSEKDRSKSAEKSKIDIHKSSDEDKKQNKRKKVEGRKTKTSTNKIRDQARDEAFKRPKDSLLNKSPSRVKSAKVSKKKLIKKVDTSYEEKVRNIWNDEELNEVLNKSRSKTSDKIDSTAYKYKSRENFFFCGETNSDYENAILQSECNIKTEETVQPTSATLKLTEGKDSYSVIQTEDDFKELASLDISKRKEEIKKKLNDLRVKVENDVTKASIDEDLKIKAAIKIQAHVRGWLTRMALERYFEELNESQPWTSIHQEYSSYADSKLSKSSKTSSKSSVVLPSSSSKISSICRVNTEKLQIDADLVLKTESQWRDIQKEKLVRLKNKDFEDLKKIAKDFGSEASLMPFFEQLLERRYANIDQIFDEHLQAVKDVVQLAIDDQVPNAPTGNGYELEVDSMDSGKQAAHNNQAKSIVDFASIKFYSEGEEASIRISEIDLASDKQGVVVLTNRTVEEIRFSLELNLNKIEFRKNENLSPAPKTCSEPAFPIFQSDVIDICELIVVHDTFVESFEAAWDQVIFESTVKFLDKVLSSMVEAEISEFESNQKQEKTVKIEKQSINELKPLNLVECYQLDDLFIENFIKTLLEFFYKVNYDLDLPLNKPNSFTHLELLNKMQESDIGVLIDKKPNQFPIPSSLFFELSSVHQLGGQRQIHSRLLFDCINEIVLKKSIKPKEAPWSDSGPKHLFMAPISHIAFLPYLVLELKQLNRLRAGKMPVVEILNSRDSEEEIVSQMREDHLSCILAIEVIAQEPDWIDYEFEESQVKLDLSDMVLEELVEETIAILNDI